MSRIMAEAVLPKQVDAVRLVQVNQRFNAKINSENLTRLQSAVVHCGEFVSCEIEFHQDESKHRLISGSVQAQISMICQRCLEEVDLPIQSDFQVGLVFDDQQAAQLPRSYEPVELDAEGRLNLWQLIEDEMLLSLPILPAHAVGECEAKKIVAEPIAEIPDSSDERENPFAVLAKLKQK